MVGVMFAGYHEKEGREDIVYLLVNAYWEALEVTLPALPQPLHWHASANTGVEDGEICRKPVRLSSYTVLAGPRSVLVLEAV